MSCYECGTIKPRFAMRVLGGPDKGTMVFFCKQLCLDVYVERTWGSRGSHET